MSQKYPEGAVIVNGNGLLKKVLGCAGAVRFFQNADDPNSYIGSVSVSTLDSEGWTVKEEAWIPKDGEGFFWISGVGKVEKNSFPSMLFSGAIEMGNCYRTEEQALQASERVRKAYKG